MKSKVETITPKKAQDILDQHWVKEHQRKPARSVVSSYARTMRSGQWLLTHQGIAIDDAGELIDGVHRLMAVVESGATVDMMVTRDLPHNGTDAKIYTIDAIDRSHARRVGQQITLRHAVKNGNLVASMARYILWLCAYSRGILLGKFDVPACLSVLDMYGEQINYCAENRSHDYRVRNAAIAAASAFAMRACPAQTKEFYAQLTTGENVKHGDPALTCRRWLMNNAQKTGSLIEMRAVLTCAMKFVQQEKLTKLYDSEHGYNFFLEKQGQATDKLLARCGFGDRLV